MALAESPEPATLPLELMAAAEVVVPPGRTPRSVMSYITPARSEDKNSNTPKIAFTGSSPASNRHGAAGVSIPSRRTK